MQKPALNCNSTGLQTSQLHLLHHPQQLYRFRHPSEGHPLACAQPIALIRAPALVCAPPHLCHVSAGAAVPPWAWGWRPDISSPAGGRWHGSCHAAACHTARSIPCTLHRARFRGAPSPGTPEPQLSPISTGVSQGPSDLEMTLICHHLICLQLPPPF